MHTGVASWIAYWARVRGDAAAIMFDGAAITWAELADRMDHGARALAALGVRPGDRVAVLMGNRPAFYEGFLAIARLGAVFVPVNVRLSAPEVAHVLHDAGVRVLITEVAFAGLLDKLEVADVRVVDADDVLAPSLRALPSPQLDLAPTGFDALLAIVYTSGTTGRPKGAMLTNAAIQFCAQNLVHLYGYTYEDRHLVALPLCFAGGIITLSQPALLSGGTVVLEREFEPERTLHVLGAEQVTVFFTAPAVLQQLRLHPQFGPDAFKTVRLIVAGSAPVPAALLSVYQALGVNVGQGYGLTEGGTVDSFLPVEDAARKIGSVGRGCMYTEIRVTDDADRPVRAGERGEIQLRGPNLMLGYWHNVQATREAFTPDGWLRTGDVGVLDDEGYLSVVDRMKDMLITGGMNVYPAEVESVLYQHADIQEVAVVGVAHEIYGETVAAVVTLRAGAALTLPDLRAFCADKLAGYKIPRILRIVDALPRNASGKVVKYQLREHLDKER